MKNEQHTTHLTQEQLKQFRGDAVRYRHPLNSRVIYTPGVKYLAEQAGAYWLLDVIASYLKPAIIEQAATQDGRIQDLHFWRLEVREDRSGIVTARADSDCAPFVTQRIPWTDFPLESVAIWAGFDGKHWTLYLPSEH